MLIKNTGQVLHLGSVIDYTDGRTAVANDGYILATVNATINGANAVVSLAWDTDDVSLIATITPFGGGIMNVGSYTLRLTSGQDATILERNIPVTIVSELRYEQELNGVKTPSNQPYARGVY